MRHMSFSKKMVSVAALMALVIFFVAGCGSFTGGSSEPKLVFTTSKGKVEYIIEVADTFEERKEGLMFRTSVAEKHGMFFVFDYAQKLTFWMKNTLIPLDMIFLNAHYEVVHIQKNAQPCSTSRCPIYNSVQKAQYVLEVNAGEADKFGIQDGDVAELSR